MKDLLELRAMVRELTIIIIPLIVIFLIPFPLYPQVGQGGGHSGSGGHGGGHSGSGGHGLAGHNSFRGHGFWGHNRFANRGFHFGHFGHRHHKHFGEEEEENLFISSGIFFDVGIAFPFVVYPYYYEGYYPYDNYYDQTYGDLKIEAIPEEVEIFVDGRFIGRANDYKGAAIVLVPSGTHVVEFRYNGLTSSINVSVVQDTESFIGKDFRGNPKNQT
jgi:hypothetical protein